MVRWLVVVTCVLGVTRASADTPLDEAAVRAFFATQDQHLAADRSDAAALGFAAGAKLVALYWRGGVTPTLEIRAPSDLRHEMSAILGTDTRPQIARTIDAVTFASGGTSALVRGAVLLSVTEGGMLRHRAFDWQAIVTARDGKMAEQGEVLTERAARLLPMHALRHPSSPTP